MCQRNHCCGGKKWAMSHHPPLCYLGWIIIQIFVTCIGPLYNFNVVVVVHTGRPYMPWHPIPKLPPKIVDVHREAGWVDGRVSKLKDKIEGGPKSQHQCVWTPPPSPPAYPSWFPSFKFSLSIYLFLLTKTLFFLGLGRYIFFRFIYTRLVRTEKVVNTHTSNII